MSAKSMTFTYGRKITPAPYNTANVEATLTYELDDGEDPAIVADTMRRFLRHHVMAELSRIDKTLAGKVDGLDMSLDMPEVDNVESA
jgi:hypothetical protein